MKPHQKDSDSPPPGHRRIPLWLRIVLMAFLFILAAAAFYLNNLKIIEYLENR